LLAAAGLVYERRWKITRRAGGRILSFGAPGAPKLWMADE